MKKLLIKLSILAILFVAIDWAIGKTISSISIKAIGGDTGRHNEIANHTTADIILFGSSRCIHHYNPYIISDSLGLSCYNAGQDGNGILMLYPYYKMLSSRYHPKLIIYDLCFFDVGEDEHSKYIEWLRQFYGRPEVDSVVWDINPNERYKMMCKAYRYNGKGLQVIADAVHPMSQSYRGFKPLFGSIKYTPEDEDTSKYTIQKPIDPLKEKYLVRLIKDCQKNKTRLVFMVSPTYGRVQRFEYYNAISTLCQKYNVPFFYNENNRRFILNKKLFQDKVHLNNTGATEYTKLVVKEIKQLYDTIPLTTK